MVLSSSASNSKNGSPQRADFLPVRVKPGQLYGSVRVDAAALMVERAAGLDADTVRVVVCETGRICWKTGSFIA